MELAEILKKSKALARFQVSAVTKKNTDPVLRRRARFVEAVGRQLEALEAELAGKPYLRYGVRKVKETGEVIERPLRFKKWWTRDGDRFVVVLRYGTAPLFKDAIIAPTIEDVISIFDGVIEAARGGDIDGQLVAFKRGMPQRAVSNEKVSSPAKGNRPH